MRMDACGPVMNWYAWMGRQWWESLTNWWCSWCSRLPNRATSTSLWDAKPAMPVRAPNSDLRSCFWFPGLKMAGIHVRLQLLHHLERVPLKPCHPCCLCVYGYESSIQEQTLTPHQCHQDTHINTTPLFSALLWADCLEKPINMTERLVSLRQPNLVRRCVPCLPQSAQSTRCLHWGAMQEMKYGRKCQNPAGRPRSPLLFKTDERTSWLLCCMKGLFSTKTNSLQRTRKISLF